MTTRQTFWLNVVLFLGLVAVSVITIRYIIFLWPSAAGDPCADFCGMQINMEKRYFLLVALGGVLGSFVHVGTSFVDFLGNQKMVYSWVPWYLMRPFIGAALAIIFYLLLRGGIVSTQAIATGTGPSETETHPPVAVTDSLKSTDLSDSLATSGAGTPAPATPAVAKTQPPEPEPPLPFNPFGIMAIACLTGMFSKQATDKLREVFESLFNMRNKTPREDPLEPKKEDAGDEGKNNDVK